MQAGFSANPHSRARRGGRGQGAMPQAAASNLAGGQLAVRLARSHRHPLGAGERRGGGAPCRAHHRRSSPLHSPAAAPRAGPDEGAGRESTRTRTRPRREGARGPRRPALVTRLALLEYIEPQDSETPPSPANTPLTQPALPGKTVCLAFGVMPASCPARTVSSCKRLSHGQSL